MVRSTRSMSMIGWARWGPKQRFRRTCGENCDWQDVTQPRNIRRYKNPVVYFSIRRDMKARTIALTMALCFVAGAVCLASDVQIGTWKLNEAKSTFAPGASNNTQLSTRPWATK